MKKTVVVDTQSFDIRGLTRREVKQLRADGIDLSGLRPGDAEEVMDRVFAMIGLDLEQVDGLVYGQVVDLFQDIMKLSFLSEDERKNSDSASI